MYSKKILEKIICRGRIARVYRGKIKKTDTIATLAKKYKIRKLISCNFFLYTIIPNIEVIPTNKTGR